MKEHISVETVEAIEDEAKEVIEIYEEAPDGAEPEDDDDPLIGEDGVLVVETDELEVEANFSLDDFPQELSFEVSFTGWDETYERLEESHGLETHSPAWVTITLERKWKSKQGKSMAIYRVTATH